MNNTDEELRKNTNTDGEGTQTVIFKKCKLFNNHTKSEKSKAKKINDP